MYAWEVRQSPLSPDRVLLAGTIVILFLWFLLLLFHLRVVPSPRTLFFTPDTAEITMLLRYFHCLLAAYRIQSIALQKKKYIFWHFSLVKRKVIELLSAPLCHPYSLHVALQAWLFLHWAWQTEQCRVSGWSQSNIVNKEAVFQKKKKFHT